MEEGRTENPSIYEVRRAVAEMQKDFTIWDVAKALNLRWPSSLKAAMKGLLRNGEVRVVGCHRYMGRRHIYRRANLWHDRM